MAATYQQAHATLTNRNEQQYQPCHDVNYHSTAATELNALNRGPKPASHRTMHKTQTTAPTFTLCKYHSRFGTNARRCEGTANGRPCAMATKPPQKRHEQQNFDYSAPRTYAVNTSTADRTDYPQVPASNISTITVADILSGGSFLVDTGAEESVFPANHLDRKKKLVDPVLLQQTAQPFLRMGKEISHYNSELKQISHISSGSQTSHNQSLAQISFQPIDWQSISQAEN